MVKMYNPSWVDGLLGSSIRQHTAPAKVPFTEAAVSHGATRILSIDQIMVDLGRSWGCPKHHHPHSLNALTQQVEVGVALWNVGIKRIVVPNG